MLAAIWQEILERLGRLGFRDPGWKTDQVAEFRAAFDSLVESRQDEAAKDPLQIALVLLMREHQEEIQWLDISSKLEWIPAMFDGEECSRALELLEDLQRELVRHAERRGRAAHNRQEEKQRHEDLNAIGLEIERLCEELNRLVYLRQPSARISGNAPIISTVNGLSNSGNTVELKAPEPPSDLISGGVGVQLVSATIATPVDDPEDSEEEEFSTGAPSRHQIQPDLPAASVRPRHFRIVPVDHLPRRRSSLSISWKDIDWPGAIWECVGDDDVAAAYWTTRALEETRQGHLAPVPSWLLAAVQGAHWLRSDEDQIVPDLAAACMQDSPGKSLPESILALAASIGPSLLAPSTLLDLWLNRPSLCPELLVVINDIEQFRKTGLRLRIDLLNQATASIEHRNELSLVRASVEEWRDRMHRNLVEGRRRVARQLPTVPRVVEEWMAPKGPLGMMIAPILAGEYEQRESVLKLAEDWKDERLINRNFTRRSSVLLSDPNLGPLWGGPRDELVANVREGCRLAKRWYNLIKAHEGEDSAAPGEIEYMQRLKSNMMEHVPQCTSALGKLSDSTDDRAIRSAVLCLTRSLRHFLMLLDGARRYSDSPISSVWSETDGLSLVQALAKRLLFYSELELDDVGVPQLSNWPSIACLMTNKATRARTTEKAIEGWVEVRDFRFVQDLLISVSDRERPGILASVDQALSDARRHLNDAVTGLNTALDEGLEEGLIPEDERIVYSEILREIDTTDQLNYEPAWRTVAEIDTVIEARQDAHLKSLSTLWAGYSKRIETSDNIPVDLQQKLREGLEFAFRTRDIPVIEEWLAAISQTLDEGSSPKALRSFAASHSAPRDYLRESIDSHDDISRLCERGLASILSNSWSFLREALQVPPHRERQVRNAFDAWLDLKEWRTDKEPDVLIGLVMEYLGFVHSGDCIAEGIRIHSSETHKLAAQPEYMHFSLSLSDSRVAPVAEFGSYAAGKYRVLVLWGQPGVQSIEQILNRLPTENVSPALVLVCLTHLSLKRRSEIAALTRRLRLPLALLDEVLLMYLAREEDSRLRPFYECALPYGFVNPYAREASVLVSEEVFVGRKELIEDVLKKGPHCIVYGGRQLGKTALLLQVRNRYNTPQIRIAYSSLKQLDQEFKRGEAEAVWRLIDDGLRKAGAIQQSVAAWRPDAVMNRILSSVNASPPDYRLLLLLDEADEFLDADARGGLRVVAQMQRLLMDTKSRFKIVFSGNYHVQRFEDILKDNHKNDALTTSYGTIRMQQFDFAEARDLVEKPLRALGYRFDLQVLRRIVRSTLYYAGLTQLVLHHLLEHLRQSQLDTQAVPPYSISVIDVETVLRDATVRDEMRKRFEMTLELDPEYGVVLYALLLDHIQKHVSEPQFVPRDDIFQMARLRWPRGFLRLDAERFAVRLKEMQGLGLLVRDSVEGRYRLRSDAVLRLFGTETEIKVRLAKLIRKNPDNKDIYESVHDYANADRKVYSPLNRGQVRLLKLPGSGVRLLFVSEALGSNLLSDEALSHLLPRGSDNSGGGRKQIDSKALGRHSITQFLKDFFGRKEHKQGSFLLYQIPDRAAGTSALLGETVRAATAEMANYPSIHRQVRILFILQPDTAWSWLQLPIAIRADLERKVEQPVVLSRWEIPAIEQRLAGSAFDHDEETCEEVLRSTGGWPVLLDSLLERPEWASEPKVAIQRFTAELMGVSGTLREHFFSILGLRKGSVHEKALQVLRRAKHLNRSMWKLSLFGSDAGFDNDDQCQAALEYLLRIGCITSRYDEEQLAQGIEEMIVEVEPLLGSIVAEP